MSGAGELVAKAVGAIRPRLNGLEPELAIVLGSGLGGFAGRIADARRISYRDIPGFPLPTVPGHEGELLAGTVAGRRVLAQSGRSWGSACWSSPTPRAGSGARSGEAR